MDHPETEEIAAYVSQRLTPEARARVDAHLAQCRECRMILTSSQRVLHARRRPLRWLVSAAAALAILILGPWSELISKGETVRGTPGQLSTQTSAIEATLPAEGDTVAMEGLAFAWRAVGREPRYTLTVTDEQARAIWIGETADTTLTLPSSVHLENGRLYIWYVDGLGADGASFTSAVHRFVTAAR